MKLVLCCLLFVLLCLGQAGKREFDRPLKPEDYADQMDAAHKDHDDQRKVLTTVRQYLDNMAARDGDADPLKQAPVVEADIRLCLEEGDYSRRIMKINEMAATAAEQTAAGFERAANESAAPVPSPGLDAISAQIKAIDNRAREIASKSVLTDADRSELLSLDENRKQLEDAAQILERAKASPASEVAFQRAAEEMRTKQRLFVRKFEKAKVLALIENARCEAGFAILGTLRDHARVDEELRRWDVVAPGSMKVPNLSVPPDPDRPGKPQPQPAARDAGPTSKEM